MTKKTFTGIVVSNKMQKRVVVEIERRIPHPLYRKMIKKNKRIKADSHGLELKAGDKVRIEETRPVSRDTHFRVIEKMEEKK